MSATERKGPTEPLIEERLQSNLGVLSDMKSEEEREKERDTKAGIEWFLAIFN